VYQPVGTVLATSLALTRSYRKRVRKTSEIDSKARAISMLNQNIACLPLEKSQDKEKFRSARKIPPSGKPDLYCSPPHALTKTGLIHIIKRLRNETGNSRLIAFKAKSLHSRIYLLIKREQKHVYLQKSKHPEPQPAKLGSVLFGPLNDEIPESIYSQINGEMVRQAALRTKGSGGPSGVDANGFRRMLACKSFKQSSTRLCEAIARMTKTLCTQYIDPTTIEALIASRLIPLDKGEGAVRPIGVGEVIRRISAKCVMSFAKKDVVEASGSLQLCAGQKSGSEAAIHAMNTLFEADDIDAVLLIDASNAFNALNRAVALHNIRVLCPIIAAYAINTYRQPARLFIVGSKEIVSAEGTTQGDPLAMAFYAISTLPLTTSLQAASTVKQCWFADDASGAGRVTQIKDWWDALNTLGPNLGDCASTMAFYKVTALVHSCSICPLIPSYDTLNLNHSCSLVFGNLIKLVFRVIQFIGSSLQTTRLSLVAKKKKIKSYSQSLL
ncbi:Hypothetical predicted protein, partial [Paramuricea clavata]